MEGALARAGSSRCAKAMLVLALCALAQPSFASYRRLYPGPPLPRSEVAFILESGDGTYICDIDQVRLHESFWSLSHMTGAELLPGQYTVSVGYYVSSEDRVRRERNVTSADCTPLRVTLEPGHTYVVRPQLAGDAFRPRVLDAGQSWETWGLKPWEEKNLRKRLDSVDEYFKGDRREFKNLAKFAEAKARLDGEIAAVSQAWERAGPGNVVEITLADKSLVAVVDKLKEDALIYYLPDNADDTYAAKRATIRSLRILAATLDEYRSRPTP
jgi:hypothetical protein